MRNLRRWQGHFAGGTDCANIIRLGGCWDSWYAGENQTTKRYTPDRIEWQRHHRFCCFADRPRRHVNGVGQLKNRLSRATRRRQYSLRGIRGSAKAREPQGLAQRKPWLVAFSFGLLHGLGFAGGLSAAGPPVGHIPLALGFFSAGVEVGHFSFVAFSLALIASVRHWTDPAVRHWWCFRILAHCAACSILK